jgi:hypothetical protein
MRAVHLYIERGEREPKKSAQFNATTVRGGKGRGLLLAVPRRQVCLSGAAGTPTRSSN